LDAAVLDFWTQQSSDVDGPTNPQEVLMKPFQTKAVHLVLVAVALVLGYATLASAASTAATGPNGNSALVSATSIRTAESLNDGVEVLQVGTSADTDGDDVDLLGTDPMDDDAEGDGSDDGDLGL
jgi:hypothetical protein